MEGGMKNWCFLTNIYRIISKTTQDTAMVTTKNE